MGFFQARILEWVAIPFFRGSSQPTDWTWSPALQANALPSELSGKQIKALHDHYGKLLLLLLSSFSHVWLCETPKNAAHQVPRPWDSPGKNAEVGCHFLLQCMKVESESEVAQSCLTLSDPMDYRLPGSSIHGIFQTKLLEWVAMAFSDGKLEMLINMVDCTPVFTVHHLHPCSLPCKLQSLFFFFFFCGKQRILSPLEDIGLGFMSFLINEMWPEVACNFAAETLRSI